MRNLCITRVINILALWLEIILTVSCLFQLLASASSKTVALTNNSVLLPLSQTDNDVVLEAGDFLLDVVDHKSADADNYVCMAVVKNAKMLQGSTVWAANNGVPVGHRCQLRFTSTNLSLKNIDDKTGSAAADWSTPAFRNISNLTLLDSGNLVLQNESGDVVWQSFEESTVFAILPGMKFSTNSTLYSNDVSPEAYALDSSTAPGTYALRLQEDGTMYLYRSRGAARVDDVVQQNYAAGYVYWTFNIFNRNYSSPQQSVTSKVSYMSLDKNSSVLQFYDAQSRLIARIPPNDATKQSVPRRSPNDPTIAIIDSNGGYFKVFDYVFANDNTSDKYWIKAYNASNLMRCHRFGTAEKRKCGSFTLCNIIDGYCYCPDGYDHDSSGNCVAHEKTPNCSSLSNSYKYIRVPNVVFYPQLRPVPPATSEMQCSDLCSLNCNCTAALFDPAFSTCALFSSVISVPVNKSQNSVSGQVLLLKMVPDNSWQKTKMLSIAVVSAAAVLAIAAFVVFGLAAHRRRRRRKSCSSEWNMEFLDTMPRLPPRFTLKDLDIATQGFAVKLGAGGFGSVYEGVLPSGMKVAVKKLVDNSGNRVGSADRIEQNFRAELISIGAVSHVNLIKLKGFCFEADGCRLIVYEYMANGSLDRWLFSTHGADKVQLSWQQRFAIALDTAKGLAYLHHESGECIVHCDIKPENILLDETFRAKVADFGLAKLTDCEKQGFTVTTVKGTRGYLAPEWLMESTITTKSDVYSYGVVLLELISGRRSLDASGYLPVVALKHYAHSAISNTREQKDRKLRASGIASVLHELLDNKLIKSQSGRASGLTRNQELNSIKNIDELPLIMKSAFTETASMMKNIRHSGCEGQYESMIRTMKVALWCVQIEPGLRPDMATVVQMMEGVEDVPAPPLNRAVGTRSTISDAEWLQRFVMQQQLMS